MRYLIACMLLGLSSGYAQEGSDETPADVVVSGDEGSGSQEVASGTDSYQSFKRSCPCGSKPK